MNQYIIIETEFYKEYKIAMRSDRFVSETPVYMTLADRYYLGEIHENSPLTERKNRFASFELAEQAVQELLTPRSEALNILQGGK